MVMSCDRLRQTLKERLCTVGRGRSTACTVSDSVRGSPTARTRPRAVYWWSVSLWRPLRVERPISPTCAGDLGPDWYFDYAEVRALNP